MLQTPPRKLPDEPAALLRHAAAQKAGGDLDAAIDTYRRALRLRPNFAEAHFNLGNTYLQAGRWEDAARSLRRAAAVRPDWPEARNNLGHALLALGEAAEALALFQAIVAAAPHLPEAHANVGAACFLLRRLHEAEAAYARAAALRPTDAELRAKLAGVLHEQAAARVKPAPEEAVALFGRVLALQPDHQEAATMLAGTLATLGRFEEADAMLLAFPASDVSAPYILAARAVGLQAMLRLDSAERVLTQALAALPDLAAAQSRLAVNHLLQGRYAEGFALYESRFAAGLPPRQMKAPRWQGDDLRGRTLLVHAEQGLGDTLQFCRFAALAGAAGRVVLSVQPKLRGLLGSLAGIVAIVGDDEDLPPHDVQIPMMSLPAALGITLESLPGPVPYLHADPARVAFWRARLADQAGRKVGLCWAGNPENTLDRTRSIKLTQLAPLLGTPGIRFVSLQTDPRPGEDAAGTGMIDWTGELHDFAETAALIGALDLVITVDSAVAHLAGALGAHTWLMNRFNTDWRWLMGRPDSPWYPRMRIFRQNRLGDWDSVNAAIMAALSPSA